MREGTIQETLRGSVDDGLWRSAYWRRFWFLVFWPSVSMGDAAYGGQMDAVPEGGTQAGNQDLKPSRNLRILADAIAEGVVDEIVQNAVVQTISGAPDDEHVGIVF